MHYNNLSQLKANRGAVALASDEAQNIFNGAYVLAPQTPHEWSENIDDATKLINNIIKIIILIQIEYILMDVQQRVYGIRYGCT